MDISAFTPATVRVGWIGTGVMGNSMAGHILAAGYPVTVFNRSRSKTEALAAKGGFPADVREAILGERGVLKGLRAGGIVVDMTTSEPSLAVEIAAAATAQGKAALDAPVSGGDIGAREARLSIMVGGSREVAAAVDPLFKLMGTNIRYMGGPGAGQHTKMVNQVLIASNMIGVVEGLLYARKSGLDLTEAINAVSAGAAGSWSISNLGPRIVAGNFEPGFFVEHFIKDLGIALAESRRMGLALPGLALAHQLYVAVQAQGYGRKGTQALWLALETLNGLEPSGGRAASASSAK